MELLPPHVRLAARLFELPAVAIIASDPDILFWVAPLDKLSASLLVIDRGSVAPDRLAYRESVPYSSSLADLSKVINRLAWAMSDMGTRVLKDPEYQSRAKAIQGDRDDRDDRHDQCRGR